MTGTGFIDGVSGIVNRGCHNPVSRPTALAPNMLVFRNQAHLTPQDEIAFAQLFTHQPDDKNVSYTGGAGTQHRLPDYPSIALVGSYQVRYFYGLTASSPGVYSNWHPDRRAWHCDGLADTHPPPDLTTMRCIKTPSRGGETLFASSVKAAELLPTKLLVDKFDTPRGRQCELQIV